MSSFSIAPASNSILTWETKGQVWFARMRRADGSIGTPASPPGATGSRKHSRAVSNAAGEVLMVWTEGSAWKAAGTLAWQVFDADGLPIEGAAGKGMELPVWSFAACVAHADGSFEILY
jgi:hypothetical protein